VVPQAAGKAEGRPYERTWYEDAGLAFRSGAHSENTKLAKVAVARGVDLEPIDRLEEKVRMLVGMIDRLRDENAKAAEDNSRLAREVDTMRSRLAEAEGTGAELSALREERELIRTRVSEMLEQIETLNL
jgi:regulator of replication initiation timing